MGPPGGVRRMPIPLQQEGHQPFHLVLPPEDNGNIRGEDHEHVRRAGPAAAGRQGGAAVRPFARTANWTVGLAAATLVLISVAGYFYCRGQLAAIGAEHLRLIVTGPSRLQAGAAATYTVSTRSIGGGPLPAEIEVVLSAPDGSRLKAYKETADEHGLLQVVIPAGLELPAADPAQRGGPASGKPRTCRGHAGRRAGPPRHLSGDRPAAVSAGRNRPLPVADALPLPSDGGRPDARAFRNPRLRRRGGRAGFAAGRASAIAAWPTGPLSSRISWPTGNTRWWPAAPTMPSRRVADLPGQ